MQVQHNHVESYCLIVDNNDRANRRGELVLHHLLMQLR